MRDTKKVLLFCLLYLCLVAFAVICWMYPFTWAPEAEEAQPQELNPELYEKDFITLEHGQKIEIYRLKEHLNEK